MKQILRKTDKIVKENALGMAELREAQKETDCQLRDLKTQVSGMGDYHRETEEVVKETGRQLQELKAQVSGISGNAGYGTEEYFQTASSQEHELRWHSV
jgi:hypothetical protein